MNFYDISKKVRKTEVHYDVEAKTYVMRPYINRKRCYFSGKTKSEVRKKMSDYLTKIYQNQQSSASEREPETEESASKAEESLLDNPEQANLKKSEGKSSNEAGRSDELQRMLDELKTKIEQDLADKPPRHDRIEPVKIVSNQIGQNMWLYQQQPMDQVFNYSLTPTDPNISQGYREFCKKGLVTESDSENDQNFEPRVPTRNISNNPAGNPYKVSLNEYIEYWLLNYKRPVLEPSSYERLCGVYIYHIRDTIGRKPIGMVTEHDIQLLINAKANPYDPKIKGMSRSGLKKIRELLKPCMAKAVTDGLIMVNPCEGIVLPKENNLQTKTKKQFSLDDKQINTLDEVCRRKFTTTGEYRTRDGLVLLLILNLGLRAGEAIALEWADIDFARKLIHINKTVQYTRAYGEIVKNGAKTNSGNRVLPMNDTVRDILNEMRAFDVRNHVESKYVCCSLTGNRKNSRNLQRSLDRLLKLTDMTHFSLHTLRHTFGSTLIRRGVSIEVVSQLMGHANISITYNKYIHVLQEQKALAMEHVSIT